MKTINANIMAGIVGGKLSGSDCWFIGLGFLSSFGNPITANTNTILAVACWYS